MSISDIRKHMKQIQEGMGHAYSYYSHSVYDGANEVTEGFLSQINLLLQSYGDIVGKARARHPDWVDQLDSLDKEIRKCFGATTQTSNTDYCYKVVNLAMAKISELLSFVEELDTVSPERERSLKVHGKLMLENKELKKAVEIMVKYKGLPELNQLLEEAQDVGLCTDEYWVLALCSVNLIESIVNKKLKELQEATEGSFDKRYRKLVETIKEKENRDIQNLLPLALYSTIRNKLDHASHINKVSPKEAKDIGELVRKFIAEIFPKSSFRAQ
jgi:hypothetical protein